MPGVSNLLSVFSDVFRVLLSEDWLVSSTLLGGSGSLLLLVDSLFSMGSFIFVFSGSICKLLVIRIVVCKKFERVRHRYGKKRY